jgi:hypothetical protein
VPRRQPFEEVLHRDLEGERKLIQGASGYAIDRPFILLELLKSDPNGTRKLFLGYDFGMRPEASFQPCLADDLFRGVSDACSHQFAGCVHRVFLGGARTGHKSNIVHRRGSGIGEVRS